LDRSLKAPETITTVGGYIWT